MTDWPQLFLGIIAAATLVMALIQIGAVVAAVRMARKAQLALGTAQQTIVTVQQTIASVREEVRPLIAKATAIADEASKSAALATVQVAKIDRLVTDLAKRVDDTTAVVQQAIVTPAREGLALMAALKAGFAALGVGRDPRRGASHSEEEDPLFIG